MLLPADLIRAVLCCAAGLLDELLPNMEDLVSNLASDAMQH